MPLSTEPLSTGRIEFRDSLSDLEVDSLAADLTLETLQTSSPTDLATWDLLNGRLFPKRPDVELRVYGFYSSSCDLAFLRRLPNLRAFSADCLMKTSGIEHVASLDNLERLSVGIYNLESFDFLGDLPAQHLHELSLQRTKSKRPDLAVLARFVHLRRLYLEGQQKNIDVTAELQFLEDLTLRSITVDSLDFLKGLVRLWSLNIKLGGINDLSALDRMERLKYLELWQVRGLSDISVISKLIGLQYLFLQSLPNIRAIPDLSQLKSLRRLFLENLKGLTDLSSISSAPALEQFVHVSARGMEPEDYKDLLKSKILKQLSVGFGNEKKNNSLKKMAASVGIEPFEYRNFSFA